MTGSTTKSEAAIASAAAVAAKTAEIMQGASETLQSADCIEGRKLFVGGVPQGASQIDMQSYFQQYGAVESCQVMMDRETGRNRGFGFVTFAETNDATRCLDSRPHTLLDKNIEVKPTVSGPPPGLKGGTFGKGAYGVDPATKVFIGGVPHTCDSDRLREFFEENYGPVYEAQVLFDRDTNRHRGFGYVTFKTRALADAAIAGRDINFIDGKWVEVKPNTRQQGGYFAGSLAGKGKGAFSTGWPQPDAWGAYSGSFGKGGWPGVPSPQDSYAAYAAAAAAAYYQQQGWAAIANHTQHTQHATTGPHGTTDPNAAAAAYASYAQAALPGAYPGTSSHRSAPY